MEVETLMRQITFVRSGHSTGRKGREEDAGGDAAATVAPGVIETHLTQ